MMASRQQQQHASRSNPKRSGRAVSTDWSTPSRQARRTAALALVLALAAAGWAVTAAAAADPAGTTLGSLGLLDDDDGASRPAFVDEPPPVAIGGALGGKPDGSAESLAGYAQDDVTQPAFVDTPPPVAVERPPSGVAGDSLGAATGHILHPPPAYPGRPVANAQAELGNDGEIGLPDHLPDRNCRLLGPFALFVQAVMGVVVVGSLVLKRQGEKPKRPWKIWMLDISKQMLGQLFVHILNIILSSLGSLASAGENNPCSLYFINIAIDTTIGVLFIYYCMRFLTHYFTDVLGWPGFVSGQYYTTPTVLGRRRRSGPRRVYSEASSMLSSPMAPQDGNQAHPSAPQDESSSGKKAHSPQLSFFFRQLALYLLSLLLMKIMVLVLFAIFPFLSGIGRWVLGLFGEDRRAQVFFVMALFPLLMNTVQFWLIDSVLRHNPQTSRYRSEEDARNMGASFGDHGRGDTGHVHDLESARMTQQHSDEGDHTGPWSMTWWANSLGLGTGSHAGRGAYQEIASHNVSYGEEASSSNGDDDESQHTYPPVSSNSSSIAQLDGAGYKRDKGLGQTGLGHGSDDRPSTSTGANASNSPAHVSKTLATPTSSSLDTTANGGAQGDMDDAWDAWDADDADDDDNHANGDTDEAVVQATQTSGSGVAFSASRGKL